MRFRVTLSETAARPKGSCACRRFRCRCDLIERASIKELDARWNRILEEEEFISLDER